MTASEIYNALAEAKPGGKEWPSLESGFAVKCISVLDECLATIAAQERKEKRKTTISADAARIYELYPRKVGREDALVKISLALRKHEIGYLMDKTNQFALAVASWPSSYRYYQDGGDRCPNPATWFHQGRYEDDPKTWHRSGARTAAPHQRTEFPAEPVGWRRTFPDYVDVNKSWEQIDPTAQAYIIKAMSVGASLRSEADQDNEGTRLRHA